MVANQLHLHQLSLDGNRVKTLVSGLGFAVAVDFDFRFDIAKYYNNIMSVIVKFLIITIIFCCYRQGYLYWTDKIRHSIMRSNLDGSNVALLFNQSVMQPGNLMQQGT